MQPPSLQWVVFQQFELGDLFSDILQICITWELDVVLQMQLASFAVNWNDHEVTQHFQLTMHWTWFYVCEGLYRCTFIYLRCYAKSPTTWHLCFTPCHKATVSSDKWVLEFEADQTLFKNGWFWTTAAVCRQLTTSLPHGGDRFLDAGYMSVHNNGDIFSSRATEALQAQNQVDWWYYILS